MFKKIENSEEPVPEIPRKIKPMSKLAQISENSFLQSSEKKANNNTNKYNSEAKSLKAFDNDVNNETEDFSEKNRKACVEFIKKYNYLIINEEFSIEQDSLQGKKHFKLSFFLISK